MFLAAGRLELRCWATVIFRGQLVRRMAKDHGLH